MQPHASLQPARRGNPLFDPCPRRGLALRGSDCDQSQQNGGLPSPLSLHTRARHAHTRHARARTPPAACCLPDSARSPICLPARQPASQASPTHPSPIPSPPHAAGGHHHPARRRRRRSSSSHETATENIAAGITLTTT